MKLEGTYTIPAPREVVWKHLMSPDTLARAMPGCEKIKPDADGSFHAELGIGIAAVKGKYHGRIQILDAVPPEHYTMKIEGQGTGGFVKGEGKLVLTPNGSSTVVSYSGDAQVGGIIASVGQRLILGAAKQVVSQFFESFAKQVQELP